MPERNQKCSVHTTSLNRRHKRGISAKYHSFLEIGRKSKQSRFLVELLTTFNDLHMATNVSKVTSGIVNQISCNAEPDVLRSFASKIVKDYSSNLKEATKYYG